jgi:hypothetical protein
MEPVSGSVWLEALGEVVKTTAKVVGSGATVIAEAAKALTPLVKGTTDVMTKVMKNTAPVLAKVGTVIEKGARQGAKTAEKITRKPILTYREIIEYFTEQRPNIVHIAKGCICRQSIENDSGFIVYLLFLDENNQPVMDGENLPYGIKYRVAKIDDELVNTFRGKDLVIIEMKK